MHHIFRGKGYGAEGWVEGTEGKGKCVEKGRWEVSERLWVMDGWMDGHGVMGTAACRCRQVEGWATRFTSRCREAMNLADLDWVGFWSMINHLLGFEW